MQRLPPDRADALLAVAVAAAGVIPIVTLAPPRQMPAALAIVLVQAVGLAYRRRRPLFGWCLGFGVIVPVTFLPLPVNDVLIAAFIGVIFASYSLGANLEDERGWWVVAVLGVAATIAQAVYDQTTDSKLSDVVWGGFAMLIAPVLVGRLVRRRGQLNATLRARTAAAAAAGEQVAAAAVDTERERIAADLHDVVAHALSAMVVQAAVARRGATTDPERARAAFAAVEGTGREALTEIRRMLGVLRRDDLELALAPQPSLEHIRSLVERARRGGLAVELSVDGDRRELPAGVDLTAYRLVQAALQDARRTGHAGAARVLLRYEPDAVALEVRDDGPASARDLGGVPERVSLYGGELRAGAQRGGGHVVVARLPLGVPA